MRANSINRSALVAAPIIAIVAMGLFHADVSADEHVSLEHIVFLTEDAAIDVSGCDAVSVIDTRTGVAVMRGKTQVSPGRMSATSDFSTILAINSSRPPWPLDPLRGPFLYRMVRDSTDYSGWHVDAPVIGINFASHGDVAILQDDDTFLVSTVGNVPARAVPPYPTPWPRPFKVQKFQLSGFTPLAEDRWQIGPSLGNVTTIGVAADIVVDQEGELAHLVLDDDTLVTLDTESMDLVEGPIRLPPVALLDGLKPDHLGSIMNAVLSLDGRYLLSNRWWPPEISVVDLESRFASGALVPGDLPIVGGLSINR